MTPQAVMHVYQGVVLECQYCYRVCRYSEAAARSSCPDCGLTIVNWQELEKATQQGKAVPPDASMSVMEKGS
jgi:hypothetical protein